MIRIITISLGLWVLSLITAPFMVQSGSKLLQYLGTTVYFFADPLCHQLPERSLLIHELPTPVCARCFSIYLGGLLLFIFAWFKQSHQPWPKWIYFIAGSLFFIEILTEQLNIYHNSFELRLFSGFIIGILIFRIILETIVNKKVLFKNG